MPTPRRPPGLPVCGPRSRSPSHRRRWAGRYVGRAGRGRAGSMRRHNGILLVLFLWRGRLRRPPRSDGRNATDPSGCEGITGLRTRTSRFDDGKGRCVGSDRRAQPRCSGPFTWPSERSSTSSATYAPAERCECSGMPRTMTGCRRRPPCDAYLARSGPAHSR